MSPACVLLLVPHPDDEVVGCAVAIRRAATAGARFFALYLTTGVPARDALWPWQRAGHAARVGRRRREAEEAAARLGLTVAGFGAWPSRGLKAYLAEAAARIAEAAAAHDVTELWAPAWEGAHQDHDVANFLAARAAGGRPVREFAAYNYAGGQVRSGRFPDGDAGAEVIRPTAEEADWKRRLLRLYASEAGNLAHIRVDCESLRPLPEHDYRRPPHPGRLFRERFHWVPFRHPRIDFERQEEILAALAAYDASLARLREKVGVRVVPPAPPSPSRR